MKLVLLDGYVINPGDLSWKAVEEQCDEFVVYDVTTPDLIQERIGDADIVMTSKCPITKEIMEKAPNLKYISETATGYNNIDVEGASELGIAVTNIPSYSTDSVAQHAIALMMELSNQVGLHSDSVHAGDWSRCKYIAYWKKPLVLLKGKSLGIIGYGNIGKRVAEIATALGMTINVYSKDKEAAIKSDFLTLHCPLTEENTGMINEEFISQMKPGAFLINTARGGLIDEPALAKALKDGYLAGAAVDVLGTEPALEDCPLVGCENCIITPHVAWVPIEIRELLINMLADNLKSFLEGGTLNRID